MGTAGEETACAGTEAAGAAGAVGSGPGGPAGASAGGQQHGQDPGSQLNTVPKHASTQEGHQNLDSIENNSVNKFNKSKRKRVRRKQNKYKCIGLKFLGNNVNGIRQKLKALENIIVNENPSALFLQETKSGRSGKIKTPSCKKYTWYEVHRTKEAEKGEKGGGLAIGVLNVLQPSWVSDGDDDAEALTIEIWVDGFPIRLICGYGPQEYDNVSRKNRCGII